MMKFYFTGATMVGAIKVTDGSKKDMLKKTLCAALATSAQAFGETPTAECRGELGHYWFYGLSGANERPESCRLFDVDQCVGEDYSSCDYGICDLAQSSPYTTPAQDINVSPPYTDEAYAANLCTECNQCTHECRTNDVPGASDIIWKFGTCDEYSPQGYGYGQCGRGVFDGDGDVHPSVSEDCYTRQWAIDNPSPNADLVLEMLDYYDNSVYTSFRNPNTGVYEDGELEGEYLCPYEVCSQCNICTDGPGNALPARNLRH